MQYRQFGNTGIDISALGFGAMRLPFIYKNDKTLYDYEESARMMLRAYELGVNYFDTAPGYCDKESEIIVGRALKNIRRKVYISTKYSVKTDSGTDCRKLLEKSLAKMGTDYVDFYHMWGIDLETFKSKVIAPNGPLAEARKAKEEGLIRHISFSFHDAAANLVEIVESGEFETVLVQYNLLDRSNEKGIERARELGLGVVAMGPVGGGRLGSPSEKIRDLLSKEVRSNPELALRFVLTNPNISCALSGMSTMEQVEENCRVADRNESLGKTEIEEINASVAENQKLAELYCTECGYCMPCPQGVNIPLSFRLMNYHRIYGITDYASAEYKTIGKFEWMPGKDASHCTDCGVCESKCPQKLSIREQLRETHSALS